MDDKLTKKEMWAELKNRNVAKAIVDFSGGGDEGGVESVTLYDKDNKQIGTLQESHPPQTWDSEKRCWVLNRELTMDEKLVNTLAQPVYDKYYTFAGEYYVTGQVEYDVENQQSKMNGSESHEVYDSFEEDV